MPVRIGMIGVGMVGQMCHLANFVTAPGARVVALADLRPELRRRVAERFGVPRTYSTHRELLADTEIDAVVVVTRRPATGPIVLDALQSGRHVLSEKPMAYTAEQAQRLVDAASARGLTYAIGYMKRHDPGVVRAKALMSSAQHQQAFGPLLRVRAWCAGGNTGADATAFDMTDEVRPDGLSLWPVAPDWLPAVHHAEYDWLLNVHSHLFNLLRYLLADAPQVRRASLNGYNPGKIEMDFAGKSAVVEVSAEKSPNWNEGAEFIYERGSLRIDLPPPFERSGVARVATRLGSAPAVLDSGIGHGWAFERQAHAFVRDVGLRATPLASGADAVADIRTAEAVWRALLQ